MKQIITTYKGTTYEREVKDFEDYDTNLNIRYKKQKINKLKEIAEKKQLNYSDIVRGLINNYIESEQNGR